MVQSFVWDQCYMTGLPEVDQQHHRLVDLVNLFGQHLTENEIAYDEIESVLGELAQYAHHHFSEEELMMARVGIDPRHLDLQLQQHQGFLRDITLMESGIKSGNSAAAEQLLHFLIHWLAFHILGADQNMARQIESIRSGATPADAYEAEERRTESSTEPLVAALEGLFQQISVRNRELVELNQRLEAKVEERTRELRDANAHLEELALTDVLTELPNRRHATRRLADLWREASLEQTPLVCIMIDADHFKDVNDASGHDAGDGVLRELARTLAHTVRTDDVVCRLGGDEFLVICPNTDLEGGRRVAEQARRAVRELRVAAGDRVWEGSISVGLAARRDGMVHPDELLRAADRALYAAKREGRDRVSLA